ncbi:uncharacterized protein [Anabrus simplex]|uniref:uncharacterized protein n=1 Tax=Anabrus simplex TaxID=316456 RepID=UPI0035A2E23A
MKGRSLGMEVNLLILQKNSLKQQILPCQRTNPSSSTVKNGNAKISELNPTQNKGTENMSLNCTRSSEQIKLRTLLSLKADNTSQDNTEDKITFTAVIRRESGSLTDTFMTILLLVTFFEMFSSSLKPCCEIFLRQQFADEEEYSNKLCESFTVWSLLTWGVVGCPILALLTVSLPCPYQLTHHLLLAAILFFLTLVMALFILPLPSKRTTAHYRKRKPSKPIPKDDASYLHRIYASLTAVVTGISTACYFEFVLWYIDTLQGFPYNYEFLYCGYYSVTALVEVLVFMRLHQSAKIKITGSGDSSTDESEEDVSSEKVIFPKKWGKDCALKTPCDPVIIGHFLLAIQLCALVFVESAWLLLLLAPLSGCSNGLLHATRSSNWHALGYGMGCLFSGIAINVFGMKTLFWTAAGVVFGWSSMNAVCFG